MYWLGTALLLILGLRINHKVSHIMFQQDELEAKLEAISTKVDNVANDTTELLRQLNDANQNPNVDLSSQIALADSILSRLTNVDNQVPAAAPAPTEEPPAEEPTTEG